jgi:Tfp pilus assembly protein PilN
MKLPAFFGHKRSINLLPRDAFESSTLGVVLEWSLVFGKWAVILTQLVVMGAFLYRFTLDRKLTDLRKEIASNVAIIKSYEQVERDYTLLQKQVATAKTTLATQAILAKTVEGLAGITPNEIWFERINITPDNLSMTAYAASLPSFGQFLTAVQTNPLFNGVRIGKIESSASRGAQMQFDISMSLAGATPTKGAK